jgi:folate-binding protein YgfZ
MRHGAAFIRRTDLGRLRLTGADRRAYLQGLLTNDIAALEPGGGCYAAMLTAQGRMITDMRVDERGSELILQVPAELAAQVRDHLERFVFSEDVQVTDVSGALAQLSVYGPEAAAMASGLPPESRLTGDAMGGIPVVGDGDAIEHAASRLGAAGAVEASLDDLERLRIEQGIPRFGADMDAETIPLEAGIEDRAISRTKGCYVGQEVIVRVVDRGHGRVARHLVGLVLGADAGVPDRGTPVRAGDREIGRVTSAVRSPLVGRPIALGYVHRDFVAPGTAVTVDGAPAAVSALPFQPA